MPAKKALDKKKPAAKATAAPAPKPSAAAKAKAAARAPAAGIPTGSIHAIVENLQPVVDGGSFPNKAVPGEIIEVTADIFRDGHDKCEAVRKNGRFGSVGDSAITSTRPLIPPIRIVKAGAEGIGCGCFRRWAVERDDAVPFLQS